MMVETAVGLSMHPVLADASARLTSDGVRWLLLRVPQGGLVNPVGDIDLLVHGDDLDRTVTVFESLAFARVPWRGRDRHLLRHCEDTNQWLWVHLTTTLYVGGERLPADFTTGEPARSHATRMPQPDGDMEFWALLWHCLADKGRVSAHHRAALTRTSRAANADGRAAHAVSRGLRDAEAPPRLLTAVTRGEWATVDEVARTFREPAKRAWGNVSIRRVARAVVSGADAVWHWRTRRGLSVAVLGPDGAGKTTLVRGVSAAVPLPTRVVYMGLTGGALRFVRRLRVPGVVFVLSACVLWGRYLRAWSHMLRGRLVLFDRYVYDAVAPPGYSPGPFERVGRRLSGWVCPSPDLVLLLDAPGTLMHARSAEYDAATLESWRGRFLSLRARLAHLTVLDATQPAADVQAEAVALIWQSYARRWTRAERRRAERAS